MTNEYEDLRNRLSELNYMYPFSPESMPLVRALLGDLISTVTTYKALEKEDEIIKEELRLAVEEINRVGIVENPRLLKENNEMHLKMMKEGDRVEEKLAALKAEVRDRDERLLKMELVISQLNYTNQEVKSANIDLRTRIEQLLVRDGDDSRDMEAIHSVGRRHDNWKSNQPVFAPLVKEGGDEDTSSAIILNLKSENTFLEKEIGKRKLELEKLTTNFSNLESKFLNQSPLTLSGNWIGLANRGDADAVIAELNSKLDYVNSRYTELKSLHSRCGIVTDSPMIDLRESRKELNLLGAKFEKIKAEKEQLLRELEGYRRGEAGRSDSGRAAEIERLTTKCNQLEAELGKEDPTALKEENRTLRRQLDAAKREVKEVSNALKLREKEIRMVKSASTSPVKNGASDNRRLVGEIALLEEKLRQVTEDRDDLIGKLGEFEAGIDGMEKEIIKIESENIQLKKDKLMKEESFIGISKQVNEVNVILNSLSQDTDSEHIERLQFRIGLLESQLAGKESELAKLSTTVDLLQRELKMEQSRRTLDQNRAAAESPRQPRPDDQTVKEVADLKSLVKSLTGSKEQLLGQLKLMQKELNEKKAELDRFQAESKQPVLEREIAALKKSLVELDADRDELQRLCDDQSEKLESLRESGAKYRVELAELNQSLIQARMESDRLRQQLEEKELEWTRMEHRSGDLVGKMERKEAELRSVQADAATARSELVEVTRETQMLAAEVNRLRAQLHSQNDVSQRSQAEIHSLMETLKVTESERNDILSLYKQVIAEHKNVRVNFDKIQSEKLRLEDILQAKESELVRAGHSNSQLASQCRQAEVDVVALRAQISELSLRLEQTSRRRSDASPRAIGYGEAGGNLNQAHLQREKVELEKLVARTEIENNGLTNEISNLNSIIDSERGKIRELQEYIEALSAVKLGGSSPARTGDASRELERTIEQQYALIGEMDSEQARLIVENSRLREQLGARPDDAR